MTTGPEIHATLAAAVLVTGCAVGLAPDRPLGSVENPVRVGGKSGEVDYLGRLRCPSGGAPHFHIEYRAPIGPYGNKLDRFALRCIFDNRGWVVMIDRHHPDHRETRGVGGLALVESSQPLFSSPTPTAASSSEFR